MADLFGRAVTGIKADWFDLKDLHHFKQKVTNAGTELQEVTLLVPRLTDEKIGTLKEWLCGLYISYRYSFEINGDDSVTREVLRIWYEKGQFKFHLWYVKGGAKPGAKVERFDGAALPVGSMIMFPGVGGDRARSIFWALDTDYISEYKYCRFGITASCKARDDKAPVAACTLSIKLEEEPNDWQWWCSEESRIIGVDLFNEIIGNDFGRRVLEDRIFDGKTTTDWIALFIRNTPMSKDDTKSGVGDTIIRLNLENFRLRMEKIRRSILDDKEADAPFKLTWRNKREADQAKNGIADGSEARGSAS